MTTTNTSSIGATGRDYADPATWEAATDNDLVTADTVEIGELYDDATHTTRCVLNGATTDSTRYRWLRSAAGQEYDPISGTGNVIRRTVDHPAGTISCFEQYSRFSHFKVENTSTTTGANAVVRLRATGQGCTALGLVATMDNYTGSAGRLFYVDTPSHAVSCIGLGTGGSSGPNWGFCHDQVDQQGWSMQNCFAFGITGGSGVGFEYTGKVAIGVSPSYFHNNLAILNDDGYVFSNGANVSPSHNGGDQAAAAIPGTSAQGSLDEADEFLDHAGEDFRLHAAAACVDAGTTVSSASQLDGESFENGVSHGDASGTENIGPYDGRYADFSGDFEGGVGIPVTTAGDGVLTMEIAFLADFEGGVGVPISTAASAALWSGELAFSGDFEGGVGVPVSTAGVCILTLRVQPGPGTVKPAVLRFRRPHYVSQAQRLLPPGKLFRNGELARLKLLFDGLAGELGTLGDLAVQVLAELDPRTTDLLLEAWERNLGLPEACADPAGDQSAQARRAEVLWKMTAQGASTPSQLVAAAAALGFAISITEFSPFVAGPTGPDEQSKAGGELWQDAWSHAFEVNTAAETVRSFQAGQNQIGDPLREWGNAPLECALGLLKPAHTVAIFTYEGTEALAGSSPVEARQLFSWTIPTT